MELDLAPPLLRHLAASRLAVVAWQPGFEVTAWSESAERLIGVPAARAVGRSWLEHVEAADRPRMAAAAEGLASGARTAAELLVRTATPDGGWAPCLWRGSAVPGAPGEAPSLLWLVERAPHAALSAEPLFERAFRASPAAFVLCSLRDGRLLEANDAFETLTGLAPADVVGGSLYDAGLVAAPGLGGLLRRLARMPGPHATSVLFRTRDGQPRRGEAVAVRLDWQGEPCALAFLRDTTHKAQMEDALRASERRFRTLVGALPQAVLVTEDDGTLAYANPQWHALAPADVATLEEALKLVVHPDDRGTAYDAWIERYDGRELPELQVRLLGPDGQARWHLLRFTPLRMATLFGADRWLCTFTDIEREKQAEAAEAAARREAEAASQAKGAFLANMSHEIRTPLTAILGFAQVLTEEVPDEHRWIAETIVQGGQRLTRTLEALLTLSKLQADRLTLAPEPLVLHDELTVMADLYRPRAEAKGLELTYDADADAVAARAALDPGAFVSVVQNLVSNAIKFTPRGAVRVRLARDAEGWLCVRVSDTGIGISPEFLPQLFQAFHQESTGYKREHEGSGLGLHIARQLVERMGGEMDVESTPGEGTTFSARFPPTEE